MNCQTEHNREENGYDKKSWLRSGPGGIKARPPRGRRDPGTIWAAGENIPATPKPTERLLLKFGLVLAPEVICTMALGVGIHTEDMSFTDDLRGLQIPLPQGDCLKGIA